MSVKVLLSLMPGFPGASGRSASADAHGHVPVPQSRTLVLAFLLSHLSRLLFGMN